MTKVIKGLKRDLFPANPDILDGVDDLTQLNFLNEPSVLHNLQCRYSNDSIYVSISSSVLFSILNCFYYQFFKRFITSYYFQCKAGPVLISVNPLKDLQIYENDAVTAYRHKFVDIPHIYAAINTAYSDMMRGELTASVGQINIFLCYLNSQV